MQLGGDLDQQNIKQAISDSVNALEAAFEVHHEQSLPELHNQTDLSDTIQGLPNGQTTGNLLMYSTLAAAFPYSLKTVPFVRDDIERGLARKNRDEITKLNVAMPKLIEKDKLLDLSRHNTEIKIEMDEFKELDAEEDSADNLNDINEKEDDVEYIQDG